MSIHLSHKLQGLNAQTPSGLPTSVFGAMAFGCALLTAGVLGLMLWLTLAPISTVVLSRGIVSFSGDDRALSAPLEAIVVRFIKGPGQEVTAGDVIAELDPFLDGVAFSQLQARRDELEIVAARLNAEMSGQAEIVFPVLRADPNIVSIKKREANVFSAHLAQHSQLVADFDQAITNARQALSDVRAQKQAAAWAKQEISSALANITQSNATSFFAQGRIADLDAQLRQAATDEATVDQHIPQAQSSLDRLILGKQSAQEALQAHLQDELSQVDHERFSLETKIKRGTTLGMATELRASVDGVVDAKGFAAEGIHVRPGQAIVHIIPARLGDRVAIHLADAEARRIHPGQTARVRMVGGSGADQAAVVETVNGLEVQLRLTDPVNANGPGRIVPPGTVADVWMDADRRSLAQLYLHQ